MENNSEQVLWSGQPSQIDNLLPFMLCSLGCLTIVGAVVALPYATYRFLLTRCRRFKLTDQRLIITSGILSRKNDQVELFRIKDVSWEQPLFLRLFKLGRLTLATNDINEGVVIINAIRGGEPILELFRTAVTQLRQKSRVGVFEMM